MLDPDALFRKIWRLDLLPGLVAHKIVTKGLEGMQLLKATMRWKCLLVLQLEANILKHQHLLPRQSGTYLHRPRARYYRPILHILLVVVIHTTFNVVRQNQNMYSNGILLVEGNSFFKPVIAHMLSLIAHHSYVTAHCSWSLTCSLPITHH